ncbi:MAG TPA: hypothetical protein DEF06_03115, partial [Clostridiales bacterium]|nr:hypothetical protein [Clostridiales bacterium]
MPFSTVLTIRFSYAATFFLMSAVSTIPAAATAKIAFASPVCGGVSGSAGSSGSVGSSGSAGSSGSVGSVPLPPST